MLLSELFDYKNQFMKDLLTDEKLVHLLDENIPMDMAHLLAYKQVFPYEYVPETAQKGSTYICFDVDILEVYGKTFLQPALQVWVFTHRSLLRLPEGGVRPDEICSRIDQKINGSRFYGLGELNLYSVRRFAPMTDYQGKYMSFRAKEWNRVYDPNRETPSNRRRGR